MNIKKNNRKRRQIINISCKFLTIISTFLALLFMFFVYKLNLLTLKYLFIIFGLIIILYVIFFIINFKKTKLIIKEIVTVFVILFGAIFSFGMNYVDKTSDFLHSITGDLDQKEEYYVKTLNDSSYKLIEDLKNKKIGAYISADETTVKVAKDLINKKIKFELVEYEDINLMLEDLKNGMVDAILINELVNTIINEKLENLHLKIIYSVLVPIKLSSEAKTVDVTNSPFNVYISGGDAYGTINKVMNTDVNMIVSVDPVKKKLLLTSIPRDYYVKLPSKGNDAYDKLTHAGYYGIQESILAIEDLLDIDINYYVKVNFSTIESIIDAIDGIEVYSDYAFKERAFNLYSYKVGINKLNGKQALAFARERYAFKEGDVQRVKNQQKVLSAVVDKVSSSAVLITKYLDILDSVSNSFTTNLDTKSMNKLVKMQLNDMATWKVESQNLVGGGDKLAKTYTFPKMDLYVMERNEESISECANTIKKFLDN